MSVELEPFKLDLNVEGIEELEHKMNVADRGIISRVHKELYDIGVAIRDLAKELAPVRTGRLRISIFMNIVEWTLRVGATVPYALFQEFGTRYIQARKFLRNAIAAYREQVVPRIGAAIQEAIDSARSGFA